MFYRLCLILLCGLQLVASCTVSVAATEETSVPEEAEVLASEDTLAAEDTSAESRRLQNGSFEDGQDWTDNKYKQPDQSAVPAWNTTAFQGKIELFRENVGTYIASVTLQPTDGSYAAELNADEESTLYQKVKTIPSSIYEWGLDHGARNGTDIMALVIGPGQSVDPSKPSKQGRDQFMQMVDWLIDTGELTYTRENQGLCGNKTVYSKKFAANGAFEDNAGNNAFSLLPSSVYTEEWRIWIIADSRATTGTNPWGSYGANAEGSAGSDDGSGSVEVDLSKYYLYTVPAGQTDTLFAFVSVGYFDSTTTSDKANTYGNFLDRINFQLYHSLSASTSNHGSAIVGRSDGTSSGEGSETGHQVTVDKQLATFVVDGEQLKVQAVIKKADAEDGCEFVGVHYTKQDDNGDPQSYFLGLAGNVIDDDESLTEEEKIGKWLKSENDAGDTVYTYYLENLYSSTDLHFVFIKSPTITYDPNGGKPYIVARDYNTNEAPNVYSYHPVTDEDETTPTIFVPPYTSEAAVGSDGWKFMGWLLTGDTVTAADPSAFPPVNADKLGSEILSAVHTIACDYSFSGVEGDTRTQYFKVYNGNVSLTDVVGTENGENTSVVWTGGEGQEVYANIHSGLTLVAQWRWRQAFIPQVNNGAKYEDSDLGGTVEIISVADTSASNDNYDASYGDKGGKAYYAATAETVTVRAIAKDNFSFIGWYDKDGNLIATSNEYSYIETKESVKTYYARFSDSVSSFDKYVEQTSVEADGIAEYFITYENLIDQTRSALLLDTMPYNGVNGSQFSGTYTVSGLALDVSKCDIRKLAVYYTTDTAYNSATISSLGSEAETIIRGWEPVEINEDGTVPELVGVKPTAWAIVGELGAKESLHATLDLQLAPDYSISAADRQSTKYLNTLSVGGIKKVAYVNVIQRKVSGMVWSDGNGKGTRDNNEPILRGVTVELWKLKDGGDSGNLSDYVPYCYAGTEEPVIIGSGQQVSVRDASMTAYDTADKTYSFTDLPAGTYMVRFTDGTTKLAAFEVSPKGTATLASKAIAVKENDILSYAYIGNIRLTSAEVAANNNCGLVAQRSIVLNYDRKVSIPVENTFRTDAPTGVQFAAESAPSAWKASLDNIKYAAGVITLDPQSLLFSDTQSALIFYYKLRYSDGEEIVVQAKIRPADSIYYEESNDSMFVFTDGRYGQWGYYTGSYAHGEAGTTETDYDSEAAKQYQDLDDITNDYDTCYLSLTYSGGTARMVNVSSVVTDETAQVNFPSVRFTFFGTGFDLISMGNPYGGVLNVKIYKGDSTDERVLLRTCSTRYGVYFENNVPVNRDVNNLYQSTAFSQTGLEYGQYTVVVDALYSPYFDEYGQGSFDLILDGIRIINPVGLPADELDYEQKSLHEIYQQEGSNPKLFVTQFTEDSGREVTVSDILNKYGAKFEIHLAQNESLAFTVKGDAGAQLQIGAHRINGSGEGTLSVRCGDTTTGISLHSATLMHYDTGVTLDGSEQTITITNTSGEVIALTDFAYRTGTVEKIECNDKTVASAKQMLLAPDATENPEDILRIKQATIVLSKDISILFYVADQTLEGWENPYMEFTKAKYDAAGAVIGYETQTVTEYIARDGYHIYAFRGINAAEMSSLVTVTLYAERNGALFSSSCVNYSVLTYATNLLSKTTDENLKTLLVDMLNYGAAAQRYFGYNLAAPANGNLTQEQSAWGTQDMPAVTSCCEIVPQDNATVRFKSASLLLEEKVAIRYYLDLTAYVGSAEDLELHVSYRDLNGAEQTTVIDGSAGTVQQGLLRVSFDSLNAAQMRTVCSASVVSKSTGQQISDTLIYSIGSYVARAPADKNTDLFELLIAMMKYGDSTAAYVVG